MRIFRDRPEHQGGIVSKEGFLAFIALVWLSGPALGQEHLETSKAAKAISRIHELCPDAERETQELDSRVKPRPVSGQVSRPALRENLLLMAKQDQEARAFLLAAGWPWPLDPHSPPVRWMNEVDSRNLKRLKHILNQDGFPTAEEVGYDGVDAALLIAIHAARDPDFQERVLALTIRRVQRGEVPGDQVAMLTDDLLAGRGKLQRYGTNFEMRDGKLKPTPMEDEANIDKLRRSVGLGSLKNYTCVIRAMYDSADTQTQSPVPVHK